MCAETVSRLRQPAQTLWHVFLPASGDDAPLLQWPALRVALSRAAGHRYPRVAKYAPALPSHSRRFVLCGHLLCMSRAAPLDVPLLVTVAVGGEGARFGGFLPSGISPELVVGSGRPTASFGRLWLATKIACVLAMVLACCCKPQVCAQLPMSGSRKRFGTGLTQIPRGHFSVTPELVHGPGASESRQR